MSAVLVLVMLMPRVLMSLALLSVLATMDILEMDSLAKVIILA